MPVEDQATSSELLTVVCLAAAQHQPTLILLASRHEVHLAPGGGEKRFAAAGEIGSIPADALRNVLASRPCVVQQNHRSCRCRPANGANQQADGFLHLAWLGDVPWCKVDEWVGDNSSRRVLFDGDSHPGLGGSVAEIQIGILHVQYRLEQQ